MISIRRQLTRELIGAFFILLGGALAALYFAARDEIIEQFDDALRAKALAISSLTMPHDGEIRLDASDQFFRSFSKQRPLDFYEIWSPDNQVLARSESLSEANLSLPDKSLTRPRIWNLQLPDNRPGRALALRFSPEEGEHQELFPNLQLTLMVASDSEPLDEALQELLGIGCIAGVLLAGATGWLVSRVLKRGLQPLKDLADQAARINADSLTSRFPAAGLPAELQPIAGRLNELLARLEISFERERRFSADVAHELRTPLAELRTLMECALKWPEAREPATDREVLAIAAQMQAMVASLLALVRGEEQQLVAHLETVDLTKLTEDCWRPFAGRAVERTLMIIWEVATVQTLADPALLRSILGNLFENAVDYASAGGEIRIRIEGDARGVKLRVRNSTENLSMEDVAKMFDRFWRKEEARSGGKHFGLGLSLAKMFSQAMGWSLNAELDEQRRLEFVLSGPVSQPSAG
ncbi:MAG TPA: ATP-binding protein [Opitutales bacterium]|jgi:signal transduction histidine kinase|nr:ATP-binding protein [Opitutales bacterium]